LPARPCFSAKKSAFPTRRTFFSLGPVTGQLRVG
jgi:hypothetical protein